MAKFIALLTLFPLLGTSALASDLKVGAAGKGNQTNKRDQDMINCPIGE